MVLSPHEGFREAAREFSARFQEVEQTIMDSSSHLAEAVALYLKGEATLNDLRAAYEKEVREW